MNGKWETEWPKWNTVLWDEKVRRWKLRKRKTGEDQELGKQKWKTMGRQKPEKVVLLVIKR